MKVLLLVIFFVFSLSGCANRSYILVDQQTGQAVECSAQGWGWLGAPMAISMAKDCVKKYESIGYVTTDKYIASGGDPKKISFTAIPKVVFTSEPSGADVNAAQEKQLTIEQVEKAIAGACVNNDWQCTEVSQGLIEGKLVVRNKHTVVVEIPYSATGYAINYKSSVNMKYNAATGRMHPNYYKWVNILRTAIDKNINNVRIAK